MKETTLLNNISKLVDKINYKSIYIEINNEPEQIVCNIKTMFNITEIIY